MLCGNTSDRAALHVWQHAGKHDMVWLLRLQLTAPPHVFSRHAMCHMQRQSCKPHFVYMYVCQTQSLQYCIMIKQDIHAFNVLLDTHQKTHHMSSRAHTPSYATVRESDKEPTVD